MIIYKKHFYYQPSFLTNLIYLERKIHISISFLQSSFFRLHLSRISQLDIPRKPSDFWTAILLRSAPSMKVFLVVSDEALLREWVRANPRWYKGCLLVRASEIAEGFRRASYNAEIVRKLIWNLFMDTAGDRRSSIVCIRGGPRSDTLHEYYGFFDRSEFSSAKQLMYVTCHKFQNL